MMSPLLHSDGQTRASTTDMAARNRSFKKQDATTERVRVDFIKRELETGTAMANLAIAEWSMGATADARKAEVNAKMAYAEFIRFLPMIDRYLTGEDMLEIDNKRLELEGLIAAMGG